MTETVKEPDVVAHAPAEEGNAVDLAGERQTIRQRISDIYQRALINYNPSWDIPRLGEIEMQLEEDGDRLASDAAVGFVSPERAAAAFRNDAERLLAPYLD